MKVFNVKRVLKPWRMVLRQVLKRGRVVRLNCAGALGGGPLWRFHHKRPRNRIHQKVHPFEVSNVLNFMLDDRSMNLMHKQQEKFIKFVDFEKDMR